MYIAAVCAKTSELKMTSNGGGDYLGFYDILEKKKKSLSIHDKTQVSPLNPCALLSVSFFNWPLPLSFPDNHRRRLTAGDRISTKIDGRHALQPRPL